MIHDNPATRREFCVNACRVASAAMLGAVLPACGGSPTSPSAAPALPTINAAITNNVVTLTVDSSSALNSVGSAALVQTSGGNLLVAHTAQSSFTALTATCTHQACTVSGFQNGDYVCPCHGSQFNTNGGVVLGPAASPLRQFPTNLNGTTLTIVVT